MPTGLVALLDDVAAIAKVAAASVDDIGAAAARAGTKSAGVVIDDAAVTPTYVTGFDPSRELPMIWKITKGSFKNKLAFLLPAAVLLGQFAPFLFPLIFLGIIIWFLTRSVKGAGMQALSFGSSKARFIDPNDTSKKVTFKDVAGAKEAKQELEEIVDFLKNPKKFLDIGAEIPKGVMMMGAPGTGKTLLARAVAGEAGVPFYSISGSEFVEMFVGVGASRVRDLFQMAKKSAPSIIFVDEIDAVGRVRGTGIGGGNDEREQTLNQILVEMDGFEPNAKVIVMAATNRPDVLDPALLRPGRFDRRVTIDLPDRKDREDILKVHARKKPLQDDVNLALIAQRTPGFSGADLYSLMNEAAILAARETRKMVGQFDIIRSIEKVMLGPERKSHILSSKEKELTAFHEAGHATVSWLVEHASPLVKVTIVPRGQSLGAAWYLPEERQITTTEQLFDEMCATMGGRAAEEIVFGKISTGALSDLEKVTKQAYAMVSVYGMNEELGNVSFYDSSGQSDYSFSKPYSDKTAETIDKVASELIEKAYDRAKDILKENKDKLTELAHQLVKEEVIFKEDLEKIFGMKAESNNAASILHIANEKKKKEN